MEFKPGYNNNWPDHHHHHHRHHQQPDSSSSVRQQHTRGPRIEEISDEPAEAQTTTTPPSTTSTAVALVEKEHMFDKVVTPSDVGKLNRLVIPKQHAEKYFPLDSSTNEKGLLLCFEDRNGKPWRFRYSYWNSSQSYVMTKGWSRFVKEKRLDAGDTVSFGRGVGEAVRDRLFIDWKRRPEVVPNDCSSRFPRLTSPISIPSHNHVASFPCSAAGSSIQSGNYPWATSRVFMPPSTSPATAIAFDHHGYGYNATRYLYFSRTAPVPPQATVQFRNVVGSSTTATAAAAEGGAVVPMVLDSVPVAHNKAMGKRVRLFGVNLNCPDPDDSDDEAKPVPPPALRLQLGWAKSSTVPPNHHAQQQ